MTLEYWDKTSPLTLMDGVQYTPEQIFAKFPHTRKGTVVLEYAVEDLVAAIDSLPIIRSNFGIADNLTDDEALAEIIRRRTEPAASQNDQLRADIDFIAAMTGVTL